MAGKTFSDHLGQKHYKKSKNPKSALFIFRELHSTFISHEVTLENYSLVTQVLGACGNP